MVVRFRYVLFFLSSYHLSLFRFWIPRNLRETITEISSNHHPFEDLALNIRHEAYVHTLHWEESLGIH